MLLFSNIKKYDLRINKYFLPTDIISHTNNVVLQIQLNKISKVDPTSLNYLLDLPDNIIESPEYIDSMFNNIKNSIEHNKNGKLHREYGPAIIGFDENGKIIMEKWYNNGELHRKDGPAYIEYDENGKMYFETWYNYGKLHRKDGPAYIEYDENGEIVYEKWYINNVLHREDGPAKISSDGYLKYEEWYNDGNLYNKSLTLL